jgi:hypothetical protein
MPVTPVSNYPNSFYKFNQECDSTCIPKFERDYPLPSSILPTFSLNITEQAVVGHVQDYLLIPYPCDLANCLDTASLLWDMVAAKFSDIYTTEIWLQNYIFFRNDDNIFTFDNVDGSLSWEAFYLNYATNLGNCDLYGTMCLFVVELDWNDSRTVLNSVNVIARSDKSFVSVSLDSECGVVGLEYTPNGFGFPSQWTGIYNLWTWGKVWKPSLESSGEIYIKSNGIRQVLNEQLTEGWTLDIDMTEYNNHKAINVALKSVGTRVYNRDMADFSEFPIDSYGYYMETLIKEQYSFNYTDKCYSSARGKAVILNNQFSEGVSYNC